jgi:hypothetical protein
MTGYGGQVSNYLASVSSSNSTAVPGTRQIVCWVNDFDGSQLLVAVWFVPSGAKMPKPSAATNQTTGDGTKISYFVLYTPVEDYSDVLDLLRNTSNLVFAIDDTDLSNSWNFGSSYTDPQNVGPVQVTSPAPAVAVAKPVPKLTFPPDFPAHIASSLLLKPG